VHLSEINFQAMFEQQQQQQLAAVATTETEASIIIQ
jgi:preprotein translocase subunit SecB